MPILNESFELSPGNIWEATDWVFTASTAVQLAGFGLYEDPYELFTWAPFSVDMSAWPPCLFDGWTELWETFDRGAFIDTWYSGWTIKTTDDFVWSVFDDIFVGGVSTGADDFVWSVFNAIFTPGLVCLFQTALIS